MPKPILAFSCCHAPAMRPDFPRFLKSIYKKHNCGRVINLGDGVDWNSISFHEKDPSLPSAAEEFRQARKQMQQLYRAFPECDYLIGNHSDLPSRKAKSIGLPDEVIKSFADTWGVSNWRVHPRFTDLEIGGVIFRHGDKCKGGQMAALANAVSEFKSVVQGHHHSLGGVWYHSNQGKLVYGLQVGSGAVHDHPAMKYSRIYAKKPIIGCGVVYSDTLAYFEPMKIS